MEGPMEEAPVSPNQSAGLIKQTTWKHVWTTQHSGDDGVYRAPPTDSSILSTAPQAAGDPALTDTFFPNCYPTRLYDVTEDSTRNSLED